MIGPETPHAQYLHATKYRGEDETFDDFCVRYSRTVAEDERHFRRLLDALRHQRILPAGRQQLAIGRPFDITAMNCYVGGTIEDSSEGIMEELKQSMLTLRTGGGCGWDFSTIRPFGDPIRGLGLKAYATGPVSFMGCWDSMCSTVLSAGHRRGAMMGVLRVDHPDIMRFINAKADQTSLTNFNISVAITDEFMRALSDNGTYTLRFQGQECGRLRAENVWARIMERNWDWGEPGLLFIDRINEQNPLYYLETIAATNPCGEQPLPPNGACLLGSLNMVKYVVPRHKIALLQDAVEGKVDRDLDEIDFDLLRRDVQTAIRAFDNVIDCSSYPLEAQRVEQQNKRRIGLGVTGIANALEIMGHPYASQSYIEQQEKILECIRNEAYETSATLAEEKGSFPLFDCDKHLAGEFMRSLPDANRASIKQKGLRNGMLLSIAPTGTISMCADNVSSGIEPPYALSARRLIELPEGPREIFIEDYAARVYGVKGLCAESVSAQDHVRVLCSAQKYIDSSVSKTCNVQGLKYGMPNAADCVSYEEFKDLYLQAYSGGSKGCTTFNINGLRSGILTSVVSTPEPEDGAACVIDPETGVRSCDF